MGERESEGDPGTQRLLVIEDHAATARSLQKWLEVSGYRVELASTMQSGLSAARSGKFALLICDLNLPDGTGWDLVSELRRTQPVRAIAYSAFDGPELVRRSRKAGFQDHITKGSNADLLLAAIARALG